MATLIRDVGIWPDIWELEFLATGGLSFLSMVNSSPFSCFSYIVANNLHIKRGLNKSNIYLCEPKLLYLLCKLLSEWNKERALHYITTTCYDYVYVYHNLILRPLWISHVWEGCDETIRMSLCPGLDYGSAKEWFLSLAKEPEVPEVVPQSGGWAGYRVSKWAKRAWASRTRFSSFEQWSCLDYS